MSIAVSGQMEKSIADHERACLVLIEQEQQKPLPDNALIATLCDSVRMGREWVDSMRRGLTVRRLFDEREKLDAPKAEPCKWCVDGKPEWSYDAKVWIHRRDRLDRVCENPPNNYGYTTQVPEETISGERRMEPCKRCGGTRSVRVKNRLTFDTDSAAERELAYDNVPCPNCQPDRRLFTFDRYEAFLPGTAGIASTRAASVAEALAKVQGEYPGSTFRLRGEE